MKDSANELDHMIEDIDYEKTGDLLMILHYGKERTSLFFTQEEYNLDFVKTRVGSSSEWDGTSRGAKDLSRRLIGKFLSDDEVENLRKYRKKKSGMTNRERIKQFYDI